MTAHRGRGRRIGALGLLGVLIVTLPVVACSDDTGDTADAPHEDTPSEVRAPRVEGLVSGGDGVSFIGTDVASAGYVQEEFFFEGDASAYEPGGELDATGRWRVEEARITHILTRLDARNRVENRDPRPRGRWPGHPDLTVGGLSLNAEVMPSVSGRPSW